MAAIRTTSAEGQGTSPPETPKPISPRMVRGVAVGMAMAVDMIVVVDLRVAAGTQRAPAA